MSYNSIQAEQEELSEKVTRTQLNDDQKDTRKIEPKETGFQDKLKEFFGVTETGTLPKGQLTYQLPLQIHIHPPVHQNKRILQLVDVKDSAEVQQYTQGELSSQVEQISQGTPIPITEQSIQSTQPGTDDHVVCKLPEHLTVNTRVQQLVQSRKQQSFEEKEWEDNSKAKQTIGNLSDDQLLEPIVRVQQLAKFAQHPKAKQEISVQQLVQVQKGLKGQNNVFVQQYIDVRQYSSGPQPMNILQTVQVERHSCQRPQSNRQIYVNHKGKMQQPLKGEKVTHTTTVESTDTTTVTVKTIVTWSM